MYSLTSFCLFEGHSHAFVGGPNPPFAPSRDHTPIPSLHSRSANVCLPLVFHLTLVSRMLYSFQVLTSREATVTTILCSSVFLPVLCVTWDLVQLHMSTLLTFRLALYHQDGQISNLILLFCNH
jgi:hypothetical protein